MIYKKYTLMLFIVISCFIQGCTSQFWYDGLKANQRQQCLKGPASEYDECMERVDESYNDYRSKKENTQDN